MRPIRPLKRVLLIAALAAGVVAPMIQSDPALAACAGITGRYISGTVIGQDNRDVNVSIGFDVLDVNKKPINADRSTLGDYGCPKNGNHGGYSVYPKELNHFVTFEGVPANTLQSNGTRTVRTWRLSDLPSNARYVWIEVYSRGYTGSPCTTCMNPGNVTKYGYANRQLIPVGTGTATGSAPNQPLVLPLTCKYGGKTGTISGNVKTLAGAAYSLKNVYAWTMNPYNIGPYPQGWGSATIFSGGNYKVHALASGQKYRMWAITTTGKTIIVKDVVVNACQNTAKYIRG